MTTEEVIKNFLKVCGAIMNDFDTEELAIKQWNVRPRQV